MADNSPAQVGDFISDNLTYMDALAAAQEQIFVAMDMATAGTAADLDLAQVVALFDASASLYDMQAEVERVLAACAGEDKPRDGEDKPCGGEDKPRLWQLAYPYLAVEVDRRYARRDLLEQAWPQIQGIAGELAQADAPTLAKMFAAGDGEFYALALAYAALGTCDEAAQRLGRSTDEIDRAIEGLYKRIHERCANDDGSFGEGTAASYAFASALGLGDPREMAARLSELIRSEGADADAMATAYAFGVLNRYGHDDVAEDWLLAGAQPSAIQWLVEGPGGLRLADDAVAANHFVVRPYFSAQTDSVTRSYKTPRGQLFLTWERTERGIALTMMVPAGTQVDLWLDGALQVIPADPDPITQAFLVEA